MTSPADEVRTARLLLRRARMEVAVIPRFFARWPNPCLEADVDPRNAASLAAPARLGFRRVRTVERAWLIGGGWSDSACLEPERPVTAPTG